MMMAGREEYGSSSSDFCTRGLEFKSPGANKGRQQRKRAAICAVMEEQDFQLSAYGVVNSSYLASVYGSKNSESIAMAFHRGVDDEITARSIHDST